ncbi:hypothetical protein LTR36_003753 [Oleoguttula mirabilis]|uniref:Ubiquitin-protein ligase n=1 Tax=Oleoguttula mirabilis TaxID=1507867 RepID=A0AAV9JHN0_9PEZI|nr:hypothetical protein LTR36_003753 [Oleoguttula mirabilis]
MESPTPSNASFIPSALDLLLVVPRLAQRAGSLFHMPEAMDNIAGKIWNGGSMIADATGQQTANSTITNTSAAFAASTGAVLDATFSQAWQEAGEETASSMFGFVLQGIGKLKNLGGIFSYLTSRWALATFAVAIILNRTQFYASSREHLRLRWHMRLALYTVPIVAFLVQMTYVLQAMRCQTSPSFSQLHYGDPLKHIAIDFAGEGGFLYKLSSTLLFWQDDASCCAARHMSLASVDGTRSELRGSMSLLFGFFLTLCTSQLFETLSCALQGKQPMPETGMTIFEHSLAFAECEAMISSALGLGLFGLPRLDGGAGEGSGPLVSRAEVMQRLNVPPEVLLVCLISCFSHLSSATLAVTGIRHKVRLINTAVWACCYMAAFVWSFMKVFMRPVESITDLGVLRFPTVCVVGFIPHLLILIGITVCGAIYGLALLVTAFSVPDEADASRTFRGRLAWAYHNLQANVQFSSSTSIRITMSEDFYTTLLKIGFNVLTAASEAVYLNEGSRIQVAQMTWVEQKRIDELATSIETRKLPAIPPELLGEGVARGVGFADQQNAAIGLSPYARERKSKVVNGKSEKAHPGEVDSGLGIAQRRSRMQLTFDFLSGIFWLLTNVLAYVLLGVLNRFGIERRPAWLLKAAGAAEGERGVSVQATAPINKDKRDFWMMDANGRLTVPANDDVDVEVETRHRLQDAGNYTGEESLSDHLYGWWRSGGWFGNVDDSGEYREREMDDDMTSMISMSTNASTTDERSDIDESGRRTPTQSDPYGGRSRETTPAADGALDMSLLSRLLNPQSSSEREEARLLSYSLQSSRPMTRSQYRRDTDRSKAQLLNGLRGHAAAAASAASASTDGEEERDMEQFILAQRSKARAKVSRGGSSAWESGAEGMGAGGPQCVVCQSTPRTILVWPCGCLSMCDDCRVGLAARNYTKCICCRTDVAAYSRLYVP